MAGLTKKTRAQVEAILTEAGVDISSITVLTSTHADWEATVDIIQGLVNKRKLFCSDLAKINPAIKEVLKPALKSTPKTDGGGDKAKAQAIMIKLLKERNVALYDELKLAVVDEMLTLKREEMASKLGF